MASLEFSALTELFGAPFLTGALLSISLALLGCFLRLRDEWLAALGLPHMAAAGGVLGMALGLPVLVGSALATGAAAAIKSLLPGGSNSHYALMLILGWGAALMLSANVHQGSVIAEGLLRGQLYFSSHGHLYGALALLLAVLAGLKWLTRRLLTERFFPDHFPANGQARWPHGLVYHGCVVAAVVLGTQAMGAFPVFALLFIPPWVAFALARGWRQGVIASVLLALGLYVAAFLVAIGVDQPFGPTLALMLVAVTPLRLVVPFICRYRTS
ncbi:MAG: metal ABC transporter permease [Halospina sp.]